MRGKTSQSRAQSPKRLGRPPLAWDWDGTPAFPPGEGAARAPGRKAMSETCPPKAPTPVPRYNVVFCKETVPRPEVAQMESETTPQSPPKRSGSWVDCWCGRFCNCPPHARKQSSLGAGDGVWRGPVARTH